MSRAKRSSILPGFPRDWYRVERAANGLWEIHKYGRIPGVAVIRLPAPGIGPRYFEHKNLAHYHLQKIKAGRV